MFSHCGEGKPSILGWIHIRIYSKKVWSLSRLPSKEEASFLDSTICLFILPGFIYPCMLMLRMNMHLIVMLMMMMMI